MDTDKSATLAHYTEQAMLARRPHHQMMTKWLETLSPAQLLSEAKRLVQHAALAAGYGHMPQAGCTITTLSLGDAEVPVEYEYESGQRGVWSTPEKSLEEIPPSVVIVSVFIGGYWIDAEDILSAAVIDRWTQELLEGRQDQERDDYETHQAEEA
jgi:hypothetical protein